MLRIVIAAEICERSAFCNALTRVSFKAGTPATFDEAWPAPLLRSWRLGWKTLPLSRHINEPRPCLRAAGTATGRCDRLRASLRHPGIDRSMAGRQDEAAFRPWP